MANTANSAEKTTPRKGVQVHATIDADLFDALEDHRWNVRKNMVDVVKTALTEYAERNGVLPTAQADASKDESKDASKDESKPAKA